MLSAAPTTLLPVYADATTKWRKHRVSAVSLLECVKGYELSSSQLVPHDAPWIEGPIVIYVRFTR